MTWEPARRYQISVDMELSGNIGGAATIYFRTLESAIKWVNNYDPEGTVLMEIFDRHESKKINFRNKRYNWQQEGF